MQLFASPTPEQILELGNAAAIIETEVAPAKPRSRARREREGPPMQNLLRVLLLLLLTFLAPAPAFAANAVGPAPVAPPPATIKFFNRDIVTLRRSEEHTSE